MARTKQVAPAPFILPLEFAIIFYQLVAFELPPNVPVNGLAPWQRLAANVKAALIRSRRTFERLRQELEVLYVRMEVHPILATASLRPGLRTPEVRRQSRGGAEAFGLESDAFATALQRVSDQSDRHARLMITTRTLELEFYIFATDQWGIAGLSLDMLGLPQHFTDAMRTPEWRLHLT